MEVVIEFGVTQSSQSVVTLRETVVLHPNGQELFRVKGSFNTPDTLLHSTAPDVRAHPLTGSPFDIDALLRSTLRFDQETLNAVHKRYPDLKFKDEEAVQSWLEFWTKEAGMSSSLLSRLFVKRPSLSDVPISDLRRVVDYFLWTLKVPPDRFFRWLIRRPAMLYRSLENEIKPKIRLLKQSLGTVDAVIGRCITVELFQKSDVVVLENIQNLKTELKIERPELIEVVMRCPMLLTMKPENVTAKIRFYLEKAQRDRLELTEFPVCLSYGLDTRIRRRFEYMKRLEFPHRRYRLATLLRSSEEKFLKTIDLGMHKTKRLLLDDSESTTEAERIAPG